jgi:hypothetical protein
MIGRMYEDFHALPELRWFWSITAFVGYRPGVTTNGQVPTHTEAKARFVSIYCRLTAADSFPGAALI